jgi:very-short-patch-repair endonuclease
MVETSNNWASIRKYYAGMDEIILHEKSNDWAIDPCAWDGFGISMTPIESALWQDIREANAVFYPQYPIHGMFVDFANPVAKVVIECDGAEFHKDKAKDYARDVILTSRGWTVYRISGRDCKTDFDEETMETSAANKFIKQICDRHDVCRKTIDFKKKY